MKKLLLLTLFALCSFAVFAQSGIKGQVVSRNGRAAVEHVKVTLNTTGVVVTTDNNGNFIFPELERGDYRLTFTAPDFETLEVMVSVDANMRDLHTVILVPSFQNEIIDDSIFAEFDNDSSASDTQALPSALNSSKDLYNSIASYRFGEMRFNVRGYDSMYQDVYLNGIRFNDAMTGYGPWSLWSGLNDATRNQESYSGLTPTEFGVGGVGGATNVNARASQMRKGFRTSVSNANQMYRWRAMVSYASGALDNGWSYGFSVSTRQGGNGFVDGIYYNSYGYFASVEKLFGTQHRLALSIIGTPQQRGAQQASTQEAYDLFGSNYYNPNVGFQDGKMRNTRVRRTHEPIAMLNYTYDINDKVRLNVATSLRFGFNGYSALTWKDGADPRPDYYRYLPSNYLSQITSGVPGVLDATSDAQIENYVNGAINAIQVWNGYIDFDRMYNLNRREDPTTSGYAAGNRSNYMIEERHTDQLDYNFAANASFQIDSNNRIIAGINARVNRTEYYSTVKDLLGGDYWLDIDKFAERDKGSDELAYQNDVEYYLANGHARVVKEGDKYNYDYYAHLRQADVWAQYALSLGGFNMNIGGEVGMTSMWRQGLWRKGLFPNGNDSFGDSEHLNFLTYKAKAAFSYRFSGAHSLSLNTAAIADAPKFASAFVSPRTRNHTNPGLTTEKIYSAELTYNLNLPYIKARLSGYFTQMNDLSKVISYYDDTQSSFTNFAMSDIDKRYMGAEFAISVPIWGGISFQGAANYGDYRYTSNPNFVQIIDNSAEVVLEDKVNWKNFFVESTPQIAVNVGLDYRGSNNWFASVNFNYYDKLYLSMNPAYRTNNAVKSYVNILANTNATEESVVWALTNIENMRRQEDLGHAYTLSASVGKNFYIKRIYMLGFSLEAKNILNNQNIKTGGYEQMRMRRTRGYNGNASGSNPAESYYSRFDSKYFYMLGTNYFLNLYFRF